MRRNFRRPISAACAACLSLILGGCVALGRQYEGAELRTERLGGLEVGITTKGDILTIFGAPTVIQRRDIEGLLTTLAVRYQGQELSVRLDPALFDDLYIYEYRRVNRTFISVGVFTWASSVDKSDRLVFFFDPEARLAGYGFTEGTKEL